MIPAQRLYFLLLLGIVIAFLLAIIFNPTVSILCTLLYDLAVIGVAIADGWRGKTHRVEVTRQPFGRLSIGRDNPVVIQVKSSRLAVLRLRDSYPTQFKVSTPTFSLTLEANNTQELLYTIHPDKRGEFLWENIGVRQLSPWGLVWDDWQVSAEQKVAVYPDLVGLRSLSIRLTLENTGTMRQARRRTNVGTEFAELREYRQGDDPRNIDWKATARRSRPIVRVLEPEQEQTLIILLDRGRLMTAQVQGMGRFDWGLNAALSLALAGLNRGDRVGIGVFDREVSLWVPPEKGQHQLSNLIERLTPLQPALLESDYVGAINRLVRQRTRRALVVMITDLIDQTASTELLLALGRLTPRYLPFCVTLRDPQIDAIAHTPTQDIEAAYQRAVALDLLAQRQVAFAKLKQRGVLVLDAPADQVSEPLVDRYLQIKARSLL